MNQPVKLMWIVPAMLLVLLSACERSVVDIKVVTPTSTTAPTTAPTLAPTPKALPLATPYALEPAAGICTSPDGQVVLITLYEDIPDPRCSKVRPDQTLTITNQTQKTLELSIGRFTTSLEAGAAFNIDTPFGEYLEPGVHQLQVSPCCGAEIWLDSQ